MHPVTASEPSRVGLSNPNIWLPLYKQTTPLAKKALMSSLSEYVIWKMRNEEVIREERINPRRAVAALHAALFKRAEIDLASAKLPDNPLRRRAGYDRTVKATWSGLIDRAQFWIPGDYG